MLLPLDKLHQFFAPAAGRSSTATAQASADPSHSATSATSSRADIQAQRLITQEIATRLRYPVRWALLPPR